MFCINDITRRQSTLDSNIINDISKKVSALEEAAEFIDIPLKKFLNLILPHQRHSWVPSGWERSTRRTWPPAAPWPASRPSPGSAASAYSSLNTEVIITNFVTMPVRDLWSGYEKDMTPLTRVADAECSISRIRIFPSRIPDPDPWHWIDNVFFNSKNYPRFLSWIPDPGIKMAPNPWHSI